MLNVDSGNIICQDARMGVINDSQGNQFLWESIENKLYFLNFMKKVILAWESFYNT